MILCQCNVLNDQQIRAAIEHIGGGGPVTPGRIYKHLGCRPKCGRCRHHMIGYIEERIESHSDDGMEQQFVEAAE